MDTIEELVTLVGDGALLGLPTGTGDYSAVSMEAARALVRRGVRNLDIVCVPGGGMDVDMLIGAGCVASIQAGVISLGEYGAAPRYVAAQREGRIKVKESTCPAIEAALTAGERGIPFMPVRGIIGSDVVRLRSDEWKVGTNPFEPHDPILFVPAIRPDVALIHAPLADRAGNLWIGRNGHTRVLTHAAAFTIATFENWYDGNLFDDERMRAGVLPAQYVRASVHVPHATWPMRFGEIHAEDSANLRRYAKAAATQEGFDAYLQEFVFNERKVA